MFWLELSRWSTMSEPQRTVMPVLSGVSNLSYLVHPFLSHSTFRYPDAPSACRFTFPRIHRHGHTPVLPTAPSEAFPLTVWRASGTRSSVQSALTLADRSRFDLSQKERRGVIALPVAYLRAFSSSDTHRGRNEGLPWSSKRAIWAAGEHGLHVMAY